MRDDGIGESGFFEPDSMLPSQFFAALRQRPPAGPEYLLAAAVLQDAVECFQKHCDAPDTRARKLFDDAAEWIASDDREWPFSYVNICELLNLHPDYLRNGLRSWLETRRALRDSRQQALGPDLPFPAECLRAAGKLN